jgi:hypothetical protein
MKSPAEASLEDIFCIARSEVLSKPRNMVAAGRCEDV